MPRKPGKAVRWLLNLEWSMGNGQCPECCGLHAGWLADYFPGIGPRYTKKDIGHKRGCGLAAALVALGRTPDGHWPPDKGTRVCNGQTVPDREWDEIAIQNAKVMDDHSTYIVGEKHA